MNYEETREQVDMILERVKALDNAKKIQLRRAYNVSFDELRGFQQITIKNILKDTPWCYAGYMRDFIVDMCGIYVQQECKEGDPFEYCLHEIYDEGSAAVQQKIGYLVDEDEKAVLIRYIKRYIKMCKKGTKIDTAKLMTDILCWPYYNTRNEWVDVIAGVKKIDKKKEKKRERWQAIAKSAAKQAKRSRIPEIHPVMSYDKAVEYAKNCQLCLVPYENERGMKGTREVLKKIEPGMDISVMIGPEGGFSEEEIEMVREEMEVLSLGKRILRTDTAAITVMSMLMLEIEMKEEE